MAHASPEDLNALSPLLRQLREIKGLTEKKPGTYYCKGNAFIHFHISDGLVEVDIKKVPGAGFDRFAVSTSSWTKLKNGYANLRMIDERCG
jgi:hypothetical protein